MTTAIGDAPAAAPLSIRCKNPKDGVADTKRRMVISNKTSNIVKDTGGKIKLVWSDFHDGRHTKGNRSLLVHDIGAAVRTHVPMIASTFYELQPHHIGVVEKYLENFYDIPASELDMWNFIDQKSQERYADWKYKCHIHFDKHGDAVPIEFLDRPDQWDYLVNKEFRDEAKKVVSMRNKGNRNKNTELINHHPGSKPLSHRAEECLKRGHLAPSTHGKEKAQNLKRPRDEMIQEWGDADPGNVQPLSFEDDQNNPLKNSVGEQKGTEVKGMGGAVNRATKRRGGPLNVVTQEAAERSHESLGRAPEAEWSTQRAKASLQRAEESVRRVEESARQVREEQQALNVRLEELEAMIQKWAAQASNT